MNSGPRTLILALFASLIFGAAGRAGAQPHPAAVPAAAGHSDTADAATQRLLLDGVRAFRGEHYEEALKLFHQVKSQQLLQDIGFYEGMALHKLNRHAEALVAFRAAHRQGLREPIADYYQAVSCYRLGMLARARREFTALLPAGNVSSAAPLLGPRLMLGVQQFMDAIEQAGFRAADSPTDAVRGVALLPAQRTDRLQAALASAESALPRAAAESLEWLDEAAELLAGVRNPTTSRLRFRELVLRVRAALTGGSDLESRAPLAGPVAAELNLLWCRVADSPDCAL